MTDADDDIAARLGAFYEAHMPGFTAPIVDVVLATAGRSNVTLVVTDSCGRRTVVRHPPAGDLLPTAHDVGREARIIRALEVTDVPVPRVLARTDDATVLGAPFFVMTFVPGVVLDTPADADAVEPSDRRRLSIALPTHLATLHRQDPTALGLGDLGAPIGFVDRQLRRWSKQWRGRDDDTTTSHFLQVHDRLEAVRPPDATPARLVHGDYRLGNALVTDGTVAAVLDWELATLGHPVADLAYLLNNWVDEHDAAKGPISSPTAATGFADRDEVLAAYERASGARVSRADLAFFRAFSYWRLASIRSGVAARLQGADDPVDRRRGADARRSIPLLLDAAEAVLDTGSVAHIKGYR